MLIVLMLITVLMYIIYLHKCFILSLICDIMFFVRDNMKKIGLHLLKWCGILLVLFYLTIFINLILGINLTDELNGKISIVCFYISMPL